MTADIHDDLTSICGIIHETVSPEKIYLFGSYAYGEPTADSDFDICVVIPDGGARPIDAMKRIRRALFHKQTRPLDVLVYRSGAFAEKSRHATLERTITQKGVLLYER